MGDTSDRRRPENIRVGATIRALREAYGLSSDELAHAIGVSSSLVRNMESGIRRATPQVCRRIAETLGIPLAAITVADYEHIADSAMTAGGAS